MLGEVISVSTWWQRLSTRGKIVAGALFTLPFVVAAVVYMVNSDGLEPFDPDERRALVRDGLRAHRSWTR